MSCPNFFCFVRLETQTAKVTSGLLLGFSEFQSQSIHMNVKSLLTDVSLEGHKNHQKTGKGVFKPYECRTHVKECPLEQ